jgi:hypothetical protein
MLRLRFRLLSAATALVLAALLLTTLSGVAHADTLFFANITTSQENPPTNPTLTTGEPRPMPFGVATFTLNDAMTSLTFTAVVFNLDFTGSQTPDTNDNLIAAHIHAGPLVTPLTNGGVVWGFFGTPFNETNPNDNVVTPFGFGVGGMVSGKWDLAEGNNTTLGAQIPNIIAGRSYINFHTNQFQGGEIRGAILQVPEPASMLLLFAGTIGLFGVCRRKGSV